MQKFLVVTLIAIGAITANATVSFPRPPIAEKTLEAIRPPSVVAPLSAVEEFKVPQPPHEPLEEAPKVPERRPVLMPPTIPEIPESPKSSQSESVPVPAVVAKPKPEPRNILKKILDLGNNVEIQPLIIDGEKAPAASAPYIATLSISSIAYGHHCGCTIIDKKWLLTAAHCLTELENHGVGLPVYAGLNDRDKLEDAQKRIIDFAHLHKGFNGKEGSDDIALIHVSEPFTFNKNVRSIALPAMHDSFAGEVSTLYGWGLETADAIIYVKDLRVARSAVLSSDQCRKDMPEGAPVSARTICATTPACYGDGGSPLIKEDDGVALELVGITSWGYVPCEKSNPVAFTPVAEYVDWIGQAQWAYEILFG